MSSAHSHSERKSRVYRRRKFQQYVSTPSRLTAAVWRVVGEAAGIGSGVADARAVNEPP